MIFKITIGPHQVQVLELLHKPLFFLSPALYFIPKLQVRLRVTVM